jgi:hypothetical protein
MAEQKKNQPRKKSIMEKKAAYLFAGMIISELAF